MSVWQDATVVSSAPGGRVNVGSGSDAIRFMSPKFVQNDGSDYGVVGYGCCIVMGGGSGGGGSGNAGEPIGLLLILTKAS